MLYFVQYLSVPLWSIHIEIQVDAKHLTGYYKWCFVDSSGAIPTVGLRATKQKLLTLGADDSLTLFDFIATDAFKFNNPILVTAMLLDTESEVLLGIDSEMIFFNTEFKNWIRTHAIP